jgi:hypothetical protein
VFDRRLDPAQAVARGEAQLASHGATGAVAVSVETVRVTVTAYVDYEILPGGRTVTGTGTTDALLGVTSGS